jgi:hypothetical protein
MLSAVTGGSRGADFAAGVGNLALLVIYVLQRISDARLHKGPWSRVLVLLLRPGDLCVLVNVQLFD